MTWLDCFSDDLVRLLYEDYLPAPDAFDLQRAIAIPSALMDATVPETVQFWYFQHSDVVWVKRFRLIPKKMSIHATYLKKHEYLADSRYVHWPEVARIVPTCLDSSIYTKPCPWLCTEARDVQLYLTDPYHPLPSVTTLRTRVPLVSGNPWNAVRVFHQILDYRDMTLSLSLLPNIQTLVVEGIQEGCYLQIEDWNCIPPSLSSIKVSSDVILYMPNHAIPTVTKCHVNYFNRIFLERPTSFFQWIVQWQAPYLTELGLSVLLVVPKPPPRFPAVRALFLYDDAVSIEWLSCLPAVTELHCMCSPFTWLAKVDVWPRALQTVVIYRWGIRRYDRLEWSDIYWRPFHEVRPYLARVNMYLCVDETTWYELHENVFKLR